RLAEILAATAEIGIPVEEAERHRLDDLAHTEAHQGVVAYMARRRYLDLDDLLRLPGADPGKGTPLLVVLDGIPDPQNLGGICRSAEAAGAAGVVIGRHRSAEVTPAVAKAS